MPKITRKCNYCEKSGVHAESTKTYDHLGRLHILSCGHYDFDALIPYRNTRAKEFLPNDGRTPFEYQHETNDFAHRANFRTGIFHEQGVGKMFIMCQLLKTYPELYPCVILCKSALRVQWLRELFKIAGIRSQIIQQGELPLYDAYDVFIVSMDLLRNLDWIESFDVNTIVLDECQAIKNKDSKRTQNVRKLIQSKKYVLALSGTPILNNAKEYFPVLNLINPEMFWSERDYLWKYVNSYNSSYGVKYGGFQHGAYDRFKEETKDFIIRFTRDEVLPQLPKIFRKFQIHELGEDVEKHYVAMVEEFQNDAAKNGVSFMPGSSTLGYLSRMRHLVGIAKIDPTVDFVEDHLRNTDRNICLFVHHKDVGTILNEKLIPICEELGIQIPLQYTSDLSLEDRSMIDDLWHDKNHRIMIASTLAAGEGLNWQHCSDVVMVERQWNPPKEEQAEGRFPRPGNETSKIDVTYMVGEGTIDEFFSELVERKRGYLNSTVGVETKWEESEIMKELIGKLLEKGTRKWKPNSKPVKATILQFPGVEAKNA